MLRKNKVLLFILSIAFLLRIFRLGANSLYGDELTLVYDSYSILKTAQSATGQFLPLTFEMGAGRPGGYIYASLPFVALFGPTFWGARLLSLFSGLGIVFLMYLLGKKFFSREVGLWAAFLTAVSPWDLALSRAGFEAHFALFLAVFGVVAFFAAEKNPKLFFLVALSWGLTLHTYPTYKLVLLLFIFLLFIYQRKIFRKIKLGPIILFLSFVLLSALQTLFTTSEERFLRLNLFAQPKIKTELEQKVNLERSLVKIPYTPAQLAHNKFFEYERLLLASYFDNLSWDFLFLKGDGNPRHNPAEKGGLYFIEIVSLSLGVFYLFKKKKEKVLFFLIAWILIVPLGTMFLLQAHNLRNAFLLPPLILLSALGLREIFKLPRFLVFVVFLLWFIQFALVLERIYFLAPYKHASFWASEAKFVSQKAQAEKGNYDFIFIDNQIDAVEFAYPVYVQVHPREVIGQSGKDFRFYDNVYIANQLPSEARGKILIFELQDLELKIHETFQ